MKFKLSILIGPLLLWACSVDPNRGKAGGNSSDPSLQQAADATSDRETQAGHIAKNGNEGTDGSVVEVPVEEVKNGNSSVPSTDPTYPQKPGQTAGNTGENENTVTPPHKITGAFLVGSVIDSEGTAGIQVGIIAKKEDLRLADDPERYELNWVLSVDASLEGSFRLLPAKDSSFDRILVFDGTLEELESLGSEVKVQLSVSESEGESKLESVIHSNLSDLFQSSTQVP